jgi:hypothetical protein
MPNIMVVADTANAGDAVFLAERLMTVQLDDPHFAAAVGIRRRAPDDAAGDCRRSAHARRRGARSPDRRRGRRQRTRRDRGAPGRGPLDE